MKEIYSAFLFLLTITIISATIINAQNPQSFIQETNKSSPTDYLSQCIFTQKSSILRNNFNSYRNRTPITISCLGNSITNGFPYAGSEYTYPSQLLEMFNTAYGSGIFNVINHGVNGHRADEVLADLQDLDWMEQDNPDFVLLIVGGNDLYQGQSIDSTVSDVQGIIDFVTSHINLDGSNPKIIVSAMIPNMLSPPFGSIYIAIYNSSLETNLTGDFTWFTDNWDDFYDSGLGTADPLLMYDDIHPNMDGYNIMAENWFDEIRQPLIFSPNSSGINFDTVYISNVSEDSLIVIENTGTDTLIVNDLTFLNNTNVFNYSYENIGIPIMPTGKDTIFINFAPQEAINYVDTLLIVNNSENKPNLLIPLSGIGEYIPPASPTDIQIEIIGDDVIISWAEVDTTIYGTPIEVDYYLVYNSNNPYLDFTYLDSTIENTYTDEGGAISNKSFYYIKSFVGTRQKLKELQ